MGRKFRDRSQGSRSNEGARRPIRKFLGVDPNSLASENVPILSTRVLDLALGRRLDGDRVPESLGVLYP